MRVHLSAAYSINLSSTQLRCMSCTCSKEEIVPSIPITPIDEDEQLGGTRQGRAWPYGSLGKPFSVINPQVSTEALLVIKRPGCRPRGREGRTESREARGVPPKCKASSTRSDTPQCTAPLPPTGRRGPRARLSCQQGVQNAAAMKPSLSVNLPGLTGLSALDPDMARSTGFRVYKQLGAWFPEVALYKLFQLRLKI